MLQRLDRIQDQVHVRVDDPRPAQSCLPDRYIGGWATVDPVKMLAGTAPGYHLHDPLVGIFPRRSLHQYFELLRAAFARAGTVQRQDLAFFLQGPMATGRNGKLQFWREAPGLGLTGIAQIEIGPRGVIAERVAYDLNIASDLLWRACCK